jgi:hypothetical protein
MAHKPKEVDPLKKSGSDVVPKNEAWTTVTTSLARDLIHCQKKLQEEQTRRAVLEERLKHPWRFSLLATLTVAAGTYVLEIAANLAMDPQTRIPGAILLLVAAVLIFGPTLISSKK